MPKKRSLKPVNRGFATTSVQKKVEEPKAVEDTPSTPAPPSRPATPPSTSQQAIEDDNVQQFYLKVLKDVERNIKSIDYDRKLAKQLPSLEIDNINYQELQPSFSSDDTENTEKLFIKLGITYNTLKRLGFSHDSIISAFNSTNSFDLQNALVWLALNIPDDELNTTAYTTIPPSPPKPLPMPSPASASSPKKTPSSASTSTTPSKQSKPSQPIPQIALSDDDQLDPTNAYVRFKLQLDDAERAAGIVKKKKKSKTDDCSDPQVIALRAIVEELQGMYLFDKKEADNAYKEHRSELDKQLLQERLKQPQQPQGLPAEEKEKEKEKEKPTTPPADESVGDLFKEEEQEELTTDGKPMPVVEMTLPRQISARSMPRTIVEETTLKIDKSAQSYFQVISKGSRAVRASGLIQWGVEYQYARDEYEMIDIGCQNDIQAINYTALILLHAVYLKHPAACTFKPSQFPASFQNLWNELEEKRKVIEITRQSEEYKMLKQYFDEKMEATPSKSRSTPRPTKTVGMDVESPLSKAEGTQVDTKLQKDFEKRQQTDAYQTMLQARNALPIAAYRQTILDTIDSSQVMVLSGETGCGKSTQLPAFILEDALSKGQKCKIYCTEPRRISAISLGSRVSVELGEKPGMVGGPESLVGYAVRLESHIGKSTKLVYATNGIALRMLESSNGTDGKSAFDDLTHIIIDEVHERSIESDFLLIVLKSLLQQHKNLKVILMSATVDSEKISAYFGGCPVISVPGRTFPVEVRYLEDAIEFSGFKVDETSPYARNRYDKIANKGKSQLTEWNDDDDDDENNSGTSTPKDQSITPTLPKISEETFATLNHLNEYLIPYDLIVKTLERLCTDGQWIQYSNATLIFMSGMAEIRRMNDMLQEHPLFGDAAQFSIYPLHSSIATDKQGAVFDIPPPGVRKIVIATNIAETGITIPDVTCVIDTGRHREMRFDEKRQISRLLDCFIAKSNAKQRRGRAGRVREGLCFHLFTRDRFENKLSDHPLPEMTRLSLQDLALRIKIMNVQIGSSIEDVLMRALDPPTSINVQRAISSLIEVKALRSNEDITPMGRILSRLPVDVHIGKFLLFAVVFGCLDSALTIAATLNSKSPFVTPFGQEVEAMNAKKAYNDGNSDFVVIVKAYNGWKQALQNQGWAFMKRYCDQNYLSLQNLQSIEELRIQLMSYLVDANFVTLNPKQIRELNAARMVRTGRGSIRFFETPEDLNHNAGDYSILHAAIAAGLFPKLISLDWHTKTMKTIQNNAIVSIHPSSPNSKIRWQEFGSSFLCYFTLLQSKKLYAHEVAPIDIMALALMCGDLDLKIASNTVQIHNKVKIHLDLRTCAVIACLREGAQAAINAKIRGKEWSSYQNHTFGIALDVLKGLH
ncbi:P-loop containing nucleoside triphosphate hydrolase protein [Wallemia mellicola CBS 633.66]|uniref:RNA helicase n=1 Tax=Wallemia mellicola (strain ATCC MYA-4683 / CBS 633.66) TaxID=671144 RepID=I4YJR3_WALMC|nr:P-loop containing nucleoside triphosphate hydrolase protein [Wallemia mellicola CBS 633.66]EIM24205.1 P-loop containing nucleoside triphosphate hydrolase protein [Wallemia mellicola CBS 633.66]|eukprot:XP_006956024.1 P-loop containing nucleoside triphosphate hydrolase protein [Wallemia mellicola CBS 633.66]